MNNILDWGSNVRKDMMIDYCKRIYDSGAFQQSRKRQKTDRKDKVQEVERQKFLDEK